MATISLNDGLCMPQIGLAPFLKDNASETGPAVSNVLLSSSIRHVVISELLGNGHLVIDGLLNAEISRNEVFITLKLWPKDQCARDLISNFQTCLADMNIQYIDMAIIHAPIDMENRVEQWKALESLRDEGFVKSLGVAGLSITQLCEVLKHCSSPPQVCEMEVSPFYQNAEVLECCNDNGIVVLCSDVSSKGMRLDHAVLTDMAQQLGITVNQLVMRWAITQGYALLCQPTVASMNWGDSVYEGLPKNCMARLSELDEALKTSWTALEREED